MDFLQYIIFNSIQLTNQIKVMRQNKNKVSHRSLRDKNQVSQPNKFKVNRWKNQTTEVWFVQILMQNINKSYRLTTNNLQSAILYRPNLTPYPATQPISMWKFHNNKDSCYHFLSISFSGQSHTSLWRHYSSSRDFVMLSVSIICCLVSDNNSPLTVAKRVSDSNISNHPTPCTFKSSHPMHVQIIPPHSRSNHPTPCTFKSSHPMHVHIISPHAARPNHPTPCTFKSSHLKHVQSSHPMHVQIIPPHARSNHPTSSTFSHPTPCTFKSSHPMHVQIISPHARSNHPTHARSNHPTPSTFKSSHTMSEKTINWCYHLIAAMLRTCLCSNVVLLTYLLVV